MDKMKICIIGLGYIGLPTAAMFATHGHEIVGVDINSEIVDALNKGEIIIEEPYLDIMVQAAVTSGNLSARCEPEESDVFIISVPTPITHDKKADMSYVESATRSIVPYLRNNNIVILESTSPPGTVEGLMLPILSESGLKLGEELFVAHSPERVLPGQILMELVNNNRIVGGIDRKSGELVRDLYKTFVRGEILLTDATTAEMCKIMENTYRDVNIAFANELAKLCEKIGINVWEVISLCNRHPRVDIHLPGPGVGGHCLAVDPWFIVDKYPGLSNIIKLSRETNDSMPEHLLKQILGIFSDNGESERIITILGATYKADIDDIRESPILELVHEIENKTKYDIRLYDPHIKCQKYLVGDLVQAVSNSDMLILAVNHKEFKDLDFEQIGKQMRTKHILDTRNYFNVEMLTKYGFEYHLLGYK